jgi:uracil-DNA glycosylase
MDPLKSLWKEVYEANKKHFPGPFMPILGGGCVFRPKIMFVFINPTARNISSDPGWKGPRFPFIGTKQVWRIFHRAGLFDDGLMAAIEKSPWTVEFANRVMGFLEEKRFYITNIVKWTGADATLPDPAKINLFLPLFVREMEIVQPEHIVTFGLIPFERLTSKKINLGEYYTESVKSRRLRSYDLVGSSFKTKVIPCYFPVGRGNPRQAVELLKMVNKQILLK